MKRSPALFRRLALCAAGLVAWAAAAQTQTQVTPPPAASGPPPGNTMPSMSGPPTTGSTQPGSKTAPSGKPGSSTRGSLSKDDAMFVDTVAQHGFAEIQFSKLAQQRAANPAVKQFADRMVADHGSMHAELERLMAAKGNEPPRGLSNDHETLLDKLQRTQPEKFDASYMDEMVKLHRKDVGAFKKVAKSARDADVKAFAAKGLPTLEAHLELARSVQKQAKGKGS